MILGHDVGVESRRKRRDEFVCRKIFKKLDSVEVFMNAYVNTLRMSSFEIKMIIIIIVSIGRNEEKKKYTER